MDKLKYVKLENEDGSYSDNIPLAVDSDYVSVGGSNLTEELSNKANLSTVTTLSNEINVQKTRIDNLATLDEGSTTGDAELIDARIDNDNYTHNNVGDNIRANESLIKVLMKNNSKQYSNYDLGFPIKGRIQSNLWDLNIGVESLIVSSSKFLVFSNIITVQKGDTIAIDNTKYAFTYSRYNTRISAWVQPTIWYTNNIIFNNAQTILLQIKKIDDADFYPSDFDGSGVQIIKSHLLDTNFQSNLLVSKDVQNIISYKGEYCLNFSKVKQGSFRPNVYIENGETGDFDNATNNLSWQWWVYTPYILKVKKGDVLYLNDNFYQVRIYYFEDDLKTLITRSVPKPQTESFIFDNDSNIILSIAHLYKTLDNSNFEMIYTDEFNSSDIYEKIRIVRDIPSVQNLQDIKDIIPEPIYIYNRWRNKFWAPLGDSITARYQYQEYVSELLGCQYGEYGVGGTTIAKKNSSDTTAMCVRYANMDNNADIISVWGGINDFGYNFGKVGGIELGTKGSTDSTTFYGGLKVLIEGLLIKYPNKSIFFITPPRIASLAKKQELNLQYGGGDQPNQVGHYLYEYVNAIKEMCAEYAIPVLDLYNNCGVNDFNIDIMTSKKDTNVPDGLHPSILAFEKWKYAIANFMEYTL